MRGGQRAETGRDHGAGEVGGSDWGSSARGGTGACAGAAAGGQRQERGGGACLGSTEGPVCGRACRGGEEGEAWSAVLARGR